MAKFTQAVIGNELDFTGEARIDIAVSENGISSCLRRMEQVAAAFQQMDPGVAMSLRGEALRLGEHLESIVTGAAVVALQTAVVSTPVDSGEARAHWFCAINKRAPSKHTTDDLDPTGIRTIEEGTFTINDTEREPGQVIWISNTAHHATALEHGHSGQAPHGMTKLAVAAAERYVSRRRSEKRGKL